MMLDNFSIVYFGNDWRAENRTSSHHVARLLGERFPLLYIEAPGIRAPSASKRDFKKLFRKLARSLKAPIQVGEHMWVMTMPQIPFRRWSLVRRINQMFGRYLVSRAMRQLGMKRRLLWFAVPHPSPLIGHLGEEFVVYYCTDDYSDLPGVDYAEISRLDDHVTREADQVFVTATTLMARRKALNATTTYAPHGVDFAHFNKASDTTLPVALPLRNVRHPVVGYFGTIAEWVDTDLILYLAREKPEWTFLLIGLATVDVTELRNCENVILAGPQPYEELPAWARAFDVSILPFRTNQLTIASNPLKLREYLAMGKPVVSSSLPEIDRLGHCVHIAHTPSEFVEKLEEAMNRDSAADNAARLAEVRECTWDARVRDVIQTVENRMLAIQGVAAGVRSFAISED